LNNVFRYLERLVVVCEVEEQASGLTNSNKFPFCIGTINMEEGLIVVGVRGVLCLPSPRKIYHGVMDFFGGRLYL
jgi:hypothetical protein